MIMGKKFTAAVLCAVMLTGCGKKTAPDLPEIYEKNLSYTFGSYSVNLLEQYNNGNKEWEVGFNDRNGEAQSAHLKSTVYDDSMQRIYGSEEKMQKDNLFDFYAYCMRLVGRAQIWREILTNHYDIEYSGFLADHENDEVSIYAAVECAVPTYSSDRAAEMLFSEMSPENGIKFSEADLSTLVSKDYMMTLVRVTVHDGADPESYVERTKAALEDFEKCNPVNYAIKVIDDDNNTYFSKYIVLGEEKVDTDIDEDGRVFMNMNKYITAALGYNED